MNWFTIVLAFVQLAQLPSTNQQQMVPNQPACNAINAITYKATNGECNIYSSDKKECLNKFENVLYKSPILDEIIVFQDDCKKELATSHPQVIHDALIQERKLINCKRSDLNGYDKYFCRQSKKDIQRLKKILQKVTNV